MFLSGLKGLDKVTAKPRIMEWLEKFQLADKANVRIRQLSKGMAQKIQFIAAVLHQPSLVVLDEPFSGLDPVSQDIFKNAGTNLLCGFRKLWLSSVVSLLAGRGLFKLLEESTTSMRAGLRICCSLIFVMLLGVTGGTLFLFCGIVPLENWLQRQLLPQGEIDFVIYVIIVVFVILVLGLGLIFHFFIFGRVKRPKTGGFIIAALLCSSILIYTFYLNSDQSWLASLSRPNGHP